MNSPPLRSLPRIFLSGLEPGMIRIAIPEDELKKLRNVLRLTSGAPVAILPGDGTLWRCVLDGREAVVESVETIRTEPERRVTLAQALPKPENLEEVVRMGTELGVARFLVFASDRSVVRWDERKRENRLKRLRCIVRESAEQSFRARLPSVEWVDGLASVLGERAVVLSEAEHVSRTLREALKPSPTLVIGPEGGWAPREVSEIEPYAATMGPRVMRVDTAAAAACALALLGC